MNLGPPNYQTPTIRDRRVLDMRNKPGKNPTDFVKLRRKRTALQDENLICPILGICNSRNNDT